MNRRSQSQMAQSAQSTMPQTGGLLQRKCACGNHTIAGGECQECGKKRLQTKLQVNEPGDVYEQEADRIADQVMATPAHHAVRAAPPRIQRFSGQANGQMVEAPASVDQTLASPGRPLESALRQDMEQRFGHDFSRVRVHTGSTAEQSARDVNAHAYTVGHNIVFGAGRFVPGTSDGRRLLAHELTHVMHQIGEDRISVVQREPKSFPDLPRDKALARKLVFEFERAFTDFAVAEHRWVSANFLDFLTLTSQNPRVSWGHGTAFAIFSEVLGNATSTGVLNYLKLGTSKAAAGGVGGAVGGAIGNAPGAAAGYVIGILVEVAVSLLLDWVTGKDEAQAKAVAKAVAENNKLIAQQELKLNEKEDKGKQATRRAADELTQRIEVTSDTEEIYKIQREIWESIQHIAKAPDIADRSLLKRMLQEWVMEHAGDEEEANTETSDEQWEEAKNRVFGKGDIKRRPDLFAYQTRNHLHSLGLPLDTMGNLLQDAQTAAPNGADKVLDSFDGKLFYFLRGTKRPDALINTVEKGHRFMTDAGKDAIKAGRFELSIRLDLKEDDGTVWVDEFEHTFRFTGDHQEQWWTKRVIRTGSKLGGGAWEGHKSRESEVTYEVNPDND